MMRNQSLTGVQVPATAREWSVCGCHSVSFFVRTAISQYSLEYHLAVPQCQILRHLVKDSRACSRADYPGYWLWLAGGCCSRLQQRFYWHLWCFHLTGAETYSPWPRSDWKQGRQQRPDIWVKERDIRVCHNSLPPLPLPVPVCVIHLLSLPLSRTCSTPNPNHPYISLSLVVIEPSLKLLRWHLFEYLGGETAYCIILNTHTLTQTYFLPHTNTWPHSTLCVWCLLSNLAHKQMLEAGCSLLSRVQVWAKGNNRLHGSLVRVGVVSLV